MLLGLNQPIWFYKKPVDFRKQIDGLVLLIADQLNHDPVSGQLFIFRNRNANKLKLLWWDNHGFWLCYKRIEKGQFKFPTIEDYTMELTKDQFVILITGLDFIQQKYLEKINPKNFY